MSERYIIEQISMFCKNEPGRLASMARVLEENGINMLALSIAEANDFGVVRALVDKSDRAKEVLTDMGFMVKVTEVIGVNMRDEPGGLTCIATTLADADINIDYAYAYSGKGAAVLILRVSDTMVAVKAILDAGHELLSRDQLG